MNQVRSDKTTAILLGGACLGIASAVPVVNWFNCACCLWVIAGGGLSVFYYLRKTPSGASPLSYADGALLGLLAGLTGAVIETVVSIPLHFLLGGLDAGFKELVQEAIRETPDMPPWVAEMATRMMAGGFTLGLLLVELLINLFIYGIFAAIGGLLGIAIFQKAPPASSYQAPPPAPPATEASNQSPAPEPSPAKPEPPPDADSEPTEES